MKSIVYLIIGGLISIVCFTACDKELVEALQINSYIYKNNTEHTITLKKVLDGNTYEYQLKPSEEINFKATLGTGGSCSINGATTTTFNPDANCLLIHSDSLQVIFNSTKSYILTRTAIGEENVLKVENYQMKKVNNHTTYTYTFTEKDYNRAD